MPTPQSSHRLTAIRFAIRLTRQSARSRGCRLAIETVAQRGREATETVGPSGSRRIDRIAIGRDRSGRSGRQSGSGGTARPIGEAVRKATGATVHRRTSGSGPRATGGIGRKATGAASPRVIGAVVPKATGETDRKGIDPIDPRATGETDPRAIDPIDRRPTGGIVPKEIGPTDPKLTGGIGQKKIGPTDPKLTGGIVQKEIGPTDPGPIGAIDPNLIGGIGRQTRTERQKIAIGARGKRAESLGARNQRVIRSPRARNRLAVVARAVRDVLKGHAARANAATTSSCP